MSETVLGDDNWRSEAEAVINDIRDHVGEARISSKVLSTRQSIYMNVRTIEGQNYCVELSALGFRLCGIGPDQTNLDSTEYFETPYGLLNKISAKFRESFGDGLVAKLNRLAEEQERQ